MPNHLINIAYGGGTFPGTWPHRSAMCCNATQGTATTDYVYGLERLLALDGTMQTWYSSD